MGSKPLSAHEWHTLQLLIEKSAAHDTGQVFMQSRGEWQGSEWMTWLDVSMDSVTLAWPTQVEGANWHLVDADQGVWMQVRIVTNDWRSFPDRRSWEDLGAYPMDKSMHENGPWWDVVRSLAKSLEKSLVKPVVKEPQKPLRRLSLEELRARFR